MSQVKHTQIIPGKDVKPNRSSSLPVDLNPAQRNQLIDPISTVTDPVTDESSEGYAEESNPSTDSVLESADSNPSTPAIIGVKEQIVKFQPDGTAKIDLILEIEDIEGAVEYDIRVAKNAGNL